MATKTIPWSTGDGSVIITYTGESGESTLTFESTTPNTTGEERTMVITLVASAATTPVVTEVQFTIRQRALNQGLDGGYATSEGDYWVDCEKADSVYSPSIVGDELFDGGGSSS